MEHIVRLCRFLSGTEHRYCQAAILRQRVREQDLKDKRPARWVRNLDAISVVPIGP
jgi:hypothetical protein